MHNNNKSNGDSVVVWSVVVLFLVGVCTTSVEALYGSSSPVLELTPTNFKSKVFSFWLNIYYMSHPIPHNSFLLLFRTMLFIDPFEYVIEWRKLGFWIDLKLYCWIMLGGCEFKWDCVGWVFRTVVWTLQSSHTHLGEGGFCFTRRCNCGCLTLMLTNPLRRFHFLFLYCFARLKQ